MLPEEFMNGCLNGCINLRFYDYHIGVNDITRFIEWCEKQSITYLVKTIMIPEDLNVDLSAVPSRWNIYRQGLIYTST